MVNVLCDRESLMAAWVANKETKNKKETNSSKPSGKTSFLSVYAGLIYPIGVAIQRGFRIDLSVSDLE